MPFNCIVFSHKFPVSDESVVFPFSMLHSHALHFVMNMIQNLLVTEGSIHTDQCAVIIMKLITSTKTVTNKLYIFAHMNFVFLGYFVLDCKSDVKITQI
jgi:hypothetical protein